MLAPWTFLFGKLYNGEDCIYVHIVVSISWVFVRSIHINLLISCGLGDQWLLTIMVLKPEYYWIVRGITKLQMYMQRHATILCRINSTLSSMANDFLCPYHLSVQKWCEFLKWIKQSHNRYWLIATKCSKNMVVLSLFVWLWGSFGSSKWWNLSVACHFTETDRLCTGWM